MLFWPEFSIYSTLPLNFPIISAWSSPRKGSLKFNRYRIMFNSVMSPTPPRLVTQVTTTVRTKWGNFLWHVFDSHPFRGGFIAYSCGLIMVTRVTYQQTTAAESVHPRTWGLDILDLPKLGRGPPGPWPCTVGWTACRRWSWRPSPRGWGHVRGGGSNTILEDC